MCFSTVLQLVVVLIQQCSTVCYLLELAYVARPLVTPEQIQQKVETGSNILEHACSISYLLTQKQPLFIIYKIKH